MWYVSRASPIYVLIGYSRRQWPSPVISILKSKLIMCFRMIEILFPKTQPNQCALIACFIVTIANHLIHFEIHRKWYLTNGLWTRGVSLFDVSNEIDGDRNVWFFHTIRRYRGDRSLRKSHTKKGYVRMMMMMMTNVK